jgi:hypothetical protein
LLLLLAWLLQVELAKIRQQAAAEAAAAAAAKASSTAAKGKAGAKGAAAAGRRNSQDIQVGFSCKQLSCDLAYVQSADVAGRIRFNAIGASSWLQCAAPYQVMKMPHQLCS